MRCHGDETVLITGASSGIGMHLAHEFASHGHPLVLRAGRGQQGAGVLTAIHVRQFAGQDEKLCEDAPPEKRKRERGDKENERARKH